MIPGPGETCESACNLIRRGGTMPKDAGSPDRRRRRHDRRKRLDTTKPNVARVYDYLLGGIESYHADRARAAALLRICPALGIVALENRYSSPARSPGRQPNVRASPSSSTAAPVHKARAGGARGHSRDGPGSQPPSARVAYVDDDPVVLTRSRAFRAPARGVAVTAADLAAPDAVAGDRGLRAVIDLAQPVCLVFGLVLSLIPATQVRDVVAGYARLIAPGSCIVIWCGRCDDEPLWKRLREAYTAADLHNHAPAEVGGFLAGLEPVLPGIVATQHWRADWHDVPLTPPGPVYVLGGIVRKTAP